MKKKNFIRITIILVITLMSLTQFSYVKETQAYVNSTHDRMFLDIQSLLSNNKNINGVPINGWYDLVDLYAEFADYDNGRYLQIIRNATDWADASSIKPWSKRAENHLWDPIKCEAYKPGGGPIYAYNYFYYATEFYKAAKWPNIYDAPYVDPNYDWEYLDPFSGTPMNTLSDKLYRSNLENDFDRAYHCLGVVLHVLQDMFIPIHAVSTIADAKIGSNPGHTEIERAMEAYYEENWVALTNFIFYGAIGDYEAKKDWVGNYNIKGWIHQAANFSRNNNQYGNRYDIIIDFDHQKWNETCSELIQQAIKACTGMLFYFWQHVYDLDIDYDGLTISEEELYNTNYLNPDTDGDGLFDGDEIHGTNPNDSYGFKSNPTKVDSDGDTLDDKSEVYGLNSYNFISYPNTTDSDSDWLEDDWEIANGYNPMLKDTDGDGINDDFEDFDNDGLCNTEEQLYTNTNPSIWDTDGDGLGDGDEVNVYYTNPNLDNEFEDTDGDGICNVYEVDMYGTNPNIDDSVIDDDNDGLTNKEEVLNHQTDYTNPDTDGDGLQDGEEVNKYFTDPLYNDEYQDTDGDGLCNVYEVDRYHTDPTVSDADTDTDNDGLTNVEEIDTYFTYYADSDTDGDGLIDGDEVNVYYTNPNYNNANEDTDGDELSNVAEIDTYNTNPRDSDTDSDLMPDGWEVQYNTNPTSYNKNGDLDSDDLTNYNEYLEGTNPRDSDTDNDLMPDGWEVQYNTYPTTYNKFSDYDSDGLYSYLEYQYSTHPRDSDSDNDGWNDYQECITYGTDPNDANSYPIIAPNSVRNFVGTTNGINKITFTWDHPTNWESGWYYKIWRLDGGSYTIIRSTTSTSYIHYPPDLFTQYKYRIACYNNDGHVRGPYSYWTGAVKGGGFVR